jgi:hypothetical protein
MRSECYKSDLRHALSFAAIWQNCGFTGKGFPAVARVSFPFWIEKEPSSSAPGIGMESAFAVLKIGPPLR